MNNIQREDATWLHALWLAKLQFTRHTLEVAQLAGKIEGEQAARGIRIAFEDLLIGSTAKDLGYSVATLIHGNNHFIVSGPIPDDATTLLWRGTGLSPKLASQIHL